MAIQDTYFLNYEKALEVAKQQNKIDPWKVQICYYDGKKVENTLPNLIHLPLDDFINSLTYGMHRLPQEINFENTSLSQEEQNEITLFFMYALEEIEIIRDNINTQAIKLIKEAKLNFNEQLRVYIPAHAMTQVMQHVAKAIAFEFESMGCKVLYNLNQGTQNFFIPKLLEFNPHIIMNINHLNNEFLSKDVFNFVWFQDLMPFLQDPNPNNLRERDIIFSLLPIFDKLLERKNIPYYRQGFCVNEQIYKLNPNIKRSKKIVFIGSSYKKNIPDTPSIKKASDELKKMFLDGKSFNEETSLSIAKKYKLDFHFVHHRFIPYIIRDIGVLELCKIQTDYEIEIYGYGWETYSELKAYYKGILKYGQEIADIYNSATFSFAPHQQYTLQQRTFEAAACGAIPIVYDSREISKEDSYEEALCYYRTLVDLEQILNNDTPQKDFTKLLKDHTYKAFVDKMLTIVKENT